MDQDKIKLFEDQPIRTAWDEEHEEWYFSIVDVIAALTEQPDSRHASTYWAVLKKRLKDEGADQLLTNCKQLRLKAADGKRHMTDEVTRAWSGMSTRQYKNLKGLKKENLRDNMSTLELALNMLADDREAEKAAQKAERKAKFENAVVEIKESFTQGIDALKSDLSFTKSSFDEVAEDQKAAKAAKKAARKEKFDNAIKELRDSIAQGGEEFKSDGAVLLDSLKEIAEDAGIDMKENEAVSDAYHAVRDSFEQGIEDFKSDMTFTQENVEEIISERKEAEAAEKAAKKEAFLETVESVKESVEEGTEAFISDMTTTKESMEEIAADRNEAKAEKKAEKREKFDEKVDELKKALE